MFLETELSVQFGSSAVQMISQQFGSYLHHRIPRVEIYHYLIKVIVLHILLRDQTLGSMIHISIRK